MYRCRCCFSFLVIGGCVDDALREEAGVDGPLERVELEFVQHFARRVLLGLNQLHHLENLVPHFRVVAHHFVVDENLEEMCRGLFE